MITKSQAKYIQSLSHKKFRDELGQFVAEGPKIINEFLAAKSMTAVELFATKEWLAAAPVYAADLPVHEVSESELQRLSNLSTPNQVLGVFSMPKWAPAADGHWLLLEGIQDPGNLGTIIRCADWFGVSGICCSPDTADAFGPKVVQSAMGSLARVAISYGSLSDWMGQHSELPVWAAALDGDDLFGLAKPGRFALLVGNESKGLSMELQALATRKVRIPGKGGAESLNAAVATGILLSWLT